MTGTEELTEGVLVQVQVIDPHERVSGYRIFEDGRYQSRSRDKVEWEPGTPVKPEQMDTIRSAIRKLASDRLRDRYEPSERIEDDGNVIVQLDWRLDDRVRRVTVIRPCEVPEIDGFITRMTEIFKHQ